MNRGLNLEQKEEIVVSYNKLAMEQLQKNSFDNSMTYLKQALIAIKPVTEEKLKQKLMAITFNNLGCFFKRTKNFQEALKYLEKTVELEHKLPNESATIAGAYLNMCSIHSQLSDHQKSLSCGLKAIYLLKTVVKDQVKHAPTLIIAYHNVASEYRLLGQIENAEDCLKAALEISDTYLSPSNSLVSGIRYNLGKLYKRGKTPNFEYFSKVPAARPQFKSLRPKSRATSNEVRKKHFEGLLTEKKIIRKKSNQHRMVFRVPQEVELQQPFVSNLFNEGEIGTQSEKTSSGLSSLQKKIDIGMIRDTEKFAVVRIQSWWRGCLARSVFEKTRVEKRVKKAEDKARKAVEEYEKIKQYATRLKSGRSFRKAENPLN